MLESCSGNFRIYGVRIRICNTVHRLRLTAFESQGLNIILVWIHDSSVSDSIYTYIYKS